MEGPKKISQFDPAESFSADDFISGIQKVTDSEYKNVKIPRSVLDSLYYLASNPSNYISGITKAMVENALTGNEITSHYHDGRYSQLGHEHTFASLTSKPTTLAGYGITDAYTQSYINSNFINTDQKGAANGVATLDAGGKVPSAQLPSTLLIYKGVWNPVTNTPTLLDIDGSKAGFVYNVGTAGSQFGIDWNLGDWAIYNDLGVLEKSDNSDDVVSVNGKQGAVTLNTDDIDELASATNLYFTDARARSAISLTTSGTSGVATYTPATGVLNIPQYQAALTNPVTGTGANTMIPYWTGEHTLGYDPTFSINTTIKYVTTKGLIVDDGANGGLVIVGSGNGVSSDGTGGRDFSFRQENSVDGIIWIGSRGNVLVTLDMLNEGTGKSFTIQNHGRKGGGTPLFSVDDAGLVTVPTSLKVNTFNGILKATNGVISEAVAGTDYANYTFASGTTNGAFSVTPSGGSAQSVAIYGLDTAAYRKAQTSATDTTANSLMQVGAFGLGGTNVLLDNFNDIVVSGLYRFSNTTPDRLFDYGTILNMRYSSGNISQLIFPVTAAGDLMFRRYQTTWRDAYTIYHTGNLGTGTSGYIPFWTGASTMGNSSNFVWDNTNGILSASKVAINKTSVTSGYILDVNGAIISAGNLTFGGKLQTGTLTNQIEQTSDNSASRWFDIDFPNVTTQQATVRLFRVTPTTAARFRIHTGGSVSTINHELFGTGNSYLCANNGGLSVGKSTLTFGYMLDVNGGINAAGKLTGYDIDIKAASAGGSRQIIFDRGLAGGYNQGTTYRNWRINVDENAAFKVQTYFNGVEIDAAVWSTNGSLTLPSALSVAGTITNEYIRTITSTTPLTIANGASSVYGWIKLGGVSTSTPDWTMGRINANTLFVWNVNDTTIARLYQNITSDNTSAPTISSFMVGVGNATRAINGDISAYNYSIGASTIIDASRNARFDNLTATGTTTLATSLTGLLKATSGVVSAATAGTDYQAPLTFGIANTNALQVDDASAADNNYAKFTATGIEGVPYATVLSDIGAAASSHTHGNITNDGKIGSAAGLPVVTTTNGALTVGVTQTPQALTTSSGTLTWNVANGYNARVTLSENVTTFTFSGAIAGDSGVLTVIQDATGGRTMVLPSGHLKEGGTLTLSTDANSKDVLGWYYDGTDYFWNIGKDFK